MAPLVVVVVALALPFCHASKYKENEKVELFVNKVGPYYNPHETYHYYSLPVCHPDTIEHKGLTLGEVLDGDRMAKSMYEINFKKNIENKELCKLKLNQEKVSALRDAIEDLYYFEFVVDDIPVRGFIGHLEESGFLPHSHKIYLWTHLHFNIDYNGEHIISANVSTRDAAPVSLDSKVDGDLEVRHTYTVQWHESKLSFKDRGTKLDKNFFPRVLEIHWLSIFNSMVLVLLLVGFVAIILTRILKNDFARYNDDDEESEDLEQDDFGWKIIHTDVFRFPQQKSLFCAVLGVGTQFLALAFGILFMAVMGLFNVHRHGAINTAGIVLFAFTSWVSGYVSANMYKKMGGEKWVWNINLTTFLFAGPLFIVWSIINSVAWAYGSTQALPWTTIILLMALWLLVGYPLSVIGGIFGKNWANGFDAPCRTKNIVREIPPLPWYRSCPIHCLVGGFLPFSAISVELYYIFSTLWGRDQYTLWGILMIVYVMLLIVTASISIAMTYFQLNAEDYRWWWRSIFTGGSTALFVLLYSCFYYFKRSNMSGTLQATKFMGFTLLMCYVAFLMLGTVSFFASLKFIRYIYVNIKMD